jgi:uncharacterized membrane protein (DUF485 family)
MANPHVYIFNMYTYSTWGVKPYRPERITDIRRRSIMAGHGPATDWGEDKASEYKARLGIYLFIFYCIVYAVYVALNVMSPKAMGTIVFWELNLAVVYGFGLIILAMVMGIIYNAMCTAAEYRMNTAGWEGK